VLTIFVDREPTGGAGIGVQCRGRRWVPDSESALNLAAARLRHVAGTEWSTKRYLSMEFSASSLN
jgi:hypothetical protein